MFQPVRIRHSHAGIRLQPLHEHTIKLPVFDYGAYSNLALRTPPRQTKLSSLQSHRSRVFARREERFPSVVNQRQTYTPQPANHGGAGRRSEPLRNIQETIRQQNKLYSAPQPAGKTTINRLPDVPQNFRNNSLSNHSQRNTSKNQAYERSEVSPSRLLGSHIAGISSKEQDTHVVRHEKMASGWAEARAGHTIPNLRDTQEAEKSPRDHTKDHSSTGRSTTHTERLPGSPSKKPAGKEETSSNKDNLARKQTEDLDSVSSGEKPAPKKAHLIKKPAYNHVKSKESSGYGSMSSGSQLGDHMAQKYSIFKPTANNDSVQDREKLREIASVYKSRVKVEDNSQTMGVSAPKQEHILTEKEAGMYTHLKSTYKQTAEQEREKRKETFFKKLQDVQIDAALLHNKELQVKAAKKEEAKKRQLEQLSHIRKKFEEDRLRRYKSQYITKNFLNYEKMDRKEYGLPEYYMKKTEYEAKLKRTGGTKVTALAFIKREVKLKKNYVKMFAEPSSVHKLDSKDPKMEGKDLVTVEILDDQGNPTKSRKVDVKSELKEANDLIQNLNTNDEDQDMPPSMEITVKETKPKTDVLQKTEKASSSPQKAEKIPSKPKPTITKTPQGKDKTRVKSVKFNSMKKAPEQEKKVAPTSQVSKPSDKSKPIQSEPYRYESKVKESIAKLEQSTKSRAPGPALSGHNQPQEAVYGSTGLLHKQPVDTFSIDSRISEESDTGVDYYEKLMAKYGIELSDDDDDSI